MDLIVEIGNSHDGSLGIATSMVDMVESTGAKCVKFQLHLPEFESTPDEPFRAKFSVQDQSRFDYWKRVNFTEEEWKYLANYTRSKGLEFLCTPFSIEAAKFLFHNNLVERWKVSSGDCTNLPLIDYMTTTNLPMLISTGLASWEEILKVRDRLGSLNYLDKVTFLHCVSQYPTKIESAGLNIIDDLRKLSGKVGLSDHSGNWIVPLKAISLGIDTLEVHLTPNRYFFGPDVSSSLTTEEISKILEIEKIWTKLENSSVDKKYFFDKAENERIIFRKGIYWSRDLKIGTKIRMEDIKFRKPVRGIDAFDFENVLGKYLINDVNINQPIQKSDFE